MIEPICEVVILWSCMIVICIYVLSLTHGGEMKMSIRSTYLLPPPGGIFTFFFSFRHGSSLPCIGTTPLNARRGRTLVLLLLILLPFVAIIFVCLVHFFFPPLGTIMTMLTDQSEKSSLDETFRKRFPDIIERWRDSSLTKDDHEYLISLQLSEVDYITITETYGLRHGTELYDHRLVVVEYPTSTHEVVTRRLEKLMDRAYQDEPLIVRIFNYLLSRYILIFSTHLRQWQRKGSRFVRHPYDHASGLSAQRY